MSGANNQDEVERVRAVYQNYREGGRELMWHEDHSIHDERSRILRAALLKATGGQSLDSAVVLDLGCGAGGLRPDLEALGVSTSRHIGVDLGFDRLHLARQEGVSAVLGSGGQLPFPDSSFDVVVASTVLSSVLDDGVLRSIATEVERVLRSGGTLLVYDMRLPSPANREVRPITGKRLEELFPGWPSSRRTCILLPPLARRVAPKPGRRYSLLASIPLLRSHAVTTLRAPSRHAERPTLGFVGPMIGRNEGYVTTQGEVLADHLREDGWCVVETSVKVGRAERLVDTVRSIRSWRVKVDTVVISIFSGPAFVMADVATYLAKRSGMKVVLWFHGGNLGPFAQRKPRWVRRVIRRGDAFVAPSRFLAEELRAFASIQVIPNVVANDAGTYRERSGGLAPKLLWMRTFHPIYNPTMAVKVLAELHRKHPDATLTMAGQADGSEQDVMAEVARLGLEDSVVMPGFLGPEAKAAAFASHDIYLNTNNVDNAPVSMIEAAAAGLPIVATRVGGIPHLIEDETTGLLVEPGDVGAMVAAVERLLDDPTLALKLSQSGRALAESSFWPSVSRQWAELFEELR